MFSIIRRGMLLISRLSPAELTEKVMGRVLLVSGDDASRKQSVQARSILDSEGAREARSNVKDSGTDIVEGMRKAFAEAARPVRAATLGSSMVTMLLDVVVDRIHRIGRRMRRR